MINTKILYVGNDLMKSSKYPTTMETLSFLLEREGFIVKKTSSKKSKLLRLLDMVLVTITSKRINYLLIDTYSTTNFYYAFIISQLARLLKKRYIPILHGGNLPSRLETSKYLSKKIFKNSYKNIAPSNYLKVAFEQKGYRVDFIPNILEIEKYTYKDRQKLEPKLLWVRSLKSLYNPLMAIEVLELIKKDYSNAKLCIIGPFAEKETHQKILDKINKCELENVVELTGALTKEEWHKKSEEFDIFINTTNFDNTPISVMEAMALGLPVVSTNVGGMPYLIKHNVDGVLVEKENSRQMAEEIMNLIRGNDETIAKNARKKVENFGWSTVRKQWFNILR